MLKTCQGPFSSRSRSLKPLPVDVMPEPSDAAKTPPLSSEQLPAQTYSTARGYDFQNQAEAPQPKPQSKPQMKQPYKWFSRAEPEKAAEQAQDDESAGRVGALYQIIDAQQSEIEELKDQLSAAQQQNQLQQKQLVYLQSQCSTANSRCIFLQSQAYQYKTNQIQLNLKLSKLYAENDSLRAAHPLQSASPAYFSERDFVFLPNHAKFSASQSFSPTYLENPTIYDLQRQLMAKSDEVNAERHRNLCLQAQLGQLRASASPSYEHAHLAIYSAPQPAAQFTSVAGL